MTPAHFDELVARATPYLLVGTRGPAAIPSRWRFFAVLFWLSQGGRQRVVTRAVDVAESTFCKFCTPVVQTCRRALPAPAWPDKSERKKIGLDFSQLTGGNHAAWRGLCWCGAVDGCHTPLLTPFGEHKEDFSHRYARCSLLFLAISDTRLIRYFVGGFPGSRGDLSAFKGRSWYRAMLD
eukprot:TRINITY_DN5373_c0_g1_i1.p1 TRINITY_DN5373_c0_g1~~TRINITY_DN5373_c0_g1_i1.p1  ORF type:complete len:180 (-),score=3.43 TRINITY_DN5373_c0_g1_i1:80-619(-)